jgi:hypothetical protein
MVIVEGCGPGTLMSQKESSTSAATAPSSSEPEGGKKATGGDAKQNPGLTFNGEVEDSLASLQVKTAALLRTSIRECFGESTSTVLRPDMFAAQTFLTIFERQTFEAQGKVKFVGIDSPYMNFVRVSSNDSSTSSPAIVSFVGSAPDVLDIETPGLEDLSGSGRATTSADSLTDRYLRSMETVGQVVAHNCKLESQACSCNTMELATAMIRRCLPLVEIESTQLEQTASQMATQCAAGQFQTRQALAALVGSYAFALRR